ncbi:hypothetical protein Agub_g8621, partial [Astrephomene gubernaculifera]
ARCATMLHRLSYFPAPQRPYIFFLEATDSQSLLAAVSRHMAATLQTMLCKALGVPATSTANNVMHVSQPPASTANGGGTTGGIGPASAGALGPLGDHVVAAGTLASYLAYLSVVHGSVRYGVALPPSLGSRSRGDGSSPGGGRGGGMLHPFPTPQLQPPRHPPLDVLQLLCVAEERGALLHVVPFVTQYLYFLTIGSRIAIGLGPDDG